MTRPHSNLLNLVIAVGIVTLAITTVTRTATAVVFGSDVAQSAPNPPIEAPAKQALDALRDMLTAYENSDATKVESAMLPTLVGLTSLLKSIQDSHIQQRAIRIDLRQTNVSASSEDVIISAAWEKRYLSAVGSAPGLARGKATFVFRRSGGQWKLAGITGNNLFAGGM